MGSLIYTNDLKNLENLLEFLGMITSVGSAVALPFK